MNELQFWVAFWKVICATLVLVVLSIGGCVSFQNVQIANLVRGGADPLSAACAISALPQGICHIVAARTQRPTNEQ